MFANVIVDISHEKLDKIFQYAIPKELEYNISEGMVVKVPFGNGNRITEAYVIELTDKCEFDISKIKQIHSIADKKISVENRMVRLASFIKHNYGGTMIQALKTVIPVKDEMSNKEKKIITLAVKGESLEKVISATRKNAVSRLRLLEALKNQEELTYEEVTGRLKVTPSVIKSMEESGIIHVKREVVYRNPFLGDENKDTSPVLNEQQQAIVEDICKEYRTSKCGTYLIHGITGSGKTEVYLHVIDEVLDMGKQVIMLIPEIALTFQTVRRFYRRFGDKVAIINSKLSKGEKYDQMLRAKNGEVSIVIGPRSALFTPFENLGLIIIDEEHEGSYKSESVPRYHAREVAEELARISGASLILGSATPSLEAYYRASQGKYKLYTLDKRAKDNSILPKVYVEDLREELKEGNRSMFSRRLKALMTERIENKQQIMLFLNRRGYSNFVSCRMCGTVVKCSHCDVSMKFHNNDTLVCHYCGSKKNVPKTCPECGSKYIAKFGTGTQKVEEAVKQLYPSARVLRMDYDTTTKKDDYDRILGAFSRGEADVLIGTQMIVKGHDFPNVTLVGIIAADLSLYASDYRASERTFQLITQAAGRAGRDNKPGEVVIQTYSPDNYSIQAASNQNYKEFYEQEIAYRELMEYPPVVNMLVVRISSVNERVSEQIAEQVGYFVRSEVDENIEVIGPINAYVYKVSDIFTNLVYIKSGAYEHLTIIKDRIEEKVKDINGIGQASVQFDFNPMNI